MATQGRSIPVSKDLMYQAKLKFPGYDDQQALTLFMIDEFSKQQSTDSQQDRLINAQRGENEKLKGALSTIGRELDQLERESAASDNEIARLKQLTDKLRPSSELTQKETARIEQELEKLRNKPGMDEKKYNELNNRVQQLIKMPGISAKEIKEIEQLITNLENQNVVTAKLFVDTKEKLDAKEERFATYIEKKKGEIGSMGRTQAQELKKYADIVNGYKKDIEDFKVGINQDRKEMEAFKDKMNDEYNIMLQLRGEVQQQLEIMQSKSDEYLDFIDLKGKEQKAGQEAQAAISQAQASSQQATLGTSEPEPNKLPEPETNIAPDLSAFSYDDEEEKNQVKTKKSTDKKIMPTDLKEDVRPARTTGDRAYDSWLDKSLPIMVKLFQKKFNRELSLKDPTYGPHQIAYAIEEFAPWLYNLKTEIVSREQMDKLLNASKVQLFRQPVEPEQFDLDLKEGLDKTYERMLDGLIDSCFAKKAK